MELEQFDFIGITERYDRGIELFCEIYRAEKPASYKPKNVNPDRNDKAYRIPEGLAGKIRSYNAVDMAIYERALRLNEEMERNLRDLP
jgi:hypothetical protein